MLGVGIVKVGFDPVAPFYVGIAFTSKGGNSRLEFSLVEKNLQWLCGAVLEVC